MVGYMSDQSDDEERWGGCLDWTLALALDTGSLGGFKISLLSCCDFFTDYGLHLFDNYSI